MGSAVSMLRADIQAHTAVANLYPLYIEPNLYAARYFLETCEDGEGIKPSERDNANVLDKLSQLKEYEVSTEVELLGENEHTIQTLLRVVATYRAMIPAPEFDTKKKYLARFRRPEPFPEYYEPVAEYDILRCQISVLRITLRCLRIITIIKDVKEYIYNQSDCIGIFNRIVDENPLDEFIRKDVKAIFKNLYAGDQSIKRMETASINVTVELMNDYEDSAPVQLAAIKRLHFLICEIEDLTHAQNEILTNEAIQSIGRALKRFPETYFDIYAHACRLFVVLISPNRLKNDDEMGVPHDGIDVAKEKTHD
ncbi:hypothetical protein THRCLA_20514 [Thraustotheca clavata]|uniref:Uncharacterized protein n=1 Tax=Thraustotheca clavata TaxID=74557 RepID=A0A1W0A6G2_9STRA|nr:hypothetical protein THRCLA_20514 [Thraustotheca clavata]